MTRSNFLLILAVLWLATCKETPSSPPLPIRQTPVPERASHQAVEMAAEGAALTVAQIRAALRRPQIQRYADPGAFRWVLDLEEPITFLRWSPLKGFVVTAGNNVHNVTSRGEDRWQVVAGEGHGLFSYGDVEMLFSPRFRRLSQLRPRGMTGWTREWTGQTVTAAGDRVYLFDASTVSELREDGRDKWRVSLPDVRNLEGPYDCGHGMLVHGMSGLKRVAAEITERGTLAKVTKLGRGAILLGAGASCEPLVWREGKLAMLDERGNRLFQRDYDSAPFVQRMGDGFAVVSSRAGLPAMYEIIRNSGETVASGELPVAGRLTTVDVFHDGFRMKALGVCLDVTNPCAKPKGNRGPYNAMLTVDPKGSFRTLVRHTVGHLNFAFHPNGGMVVASSKEEREVDIVFRDAEYNVLWQLTLPGRLSAGPVLGPYGGVYVATCHGWSCHAPYRLFAITAVKPEPEEE